MPGNSVFRRVGGLHPGKSVFDLSYDKKFTCDMGQLIPVMCDEVVPGDVFQIGNEVVLRFQPLVAPVMHEVNVFCHYFFVPYRLLWDDWEDFITGGVDGNVNDGTSDQVVLPLPRAAGADNSLGTLWDYFGFPVGKNPPGDSSPLRFPWLAYNLVWNEYYRDETLQEELPNSADPLSDEYNQYVWYRNWEKDYFTSALPWQQRGVSPALPISGVSQAVFGDLPVPSGLQVYWSHLSTPARFLRADTPVKPDTVPVLTPDDISEDPTTVGLRSLFSTSFTNTLKAWANANSVDLSNLATFDVADLRLAFQIQKWLERNARAGVRYTEFLRAHFGVSPRDERLQRPEYIGGSRSPVIVSEVLKTSTTDSTSAQGNMAGHGIAVNRGFAAKYRVHEYGLILGLMSVMPRSAYQ
jgi:hypothetical protein